MKIIDELNYLLEELDSNFLEEHKLSFVFKMSGKDEFHFGFYNEENETVTDFGIFDGEIISREEEESRSKSSEINEIDKESIKNFEKLQKKINKKTTKLDLMKKIYYLSNNEEPIWKVTFIDNTFSTKHIEFDAKTLEAKSEGVSSLIMSDSN